MSIYSHSVCNRPYMKLKSRIKALAYIPKTTARLFYHRHSDWRERGIACDISLKCVISTSFMLMKILTWIPNVHWCLCWSQFLEWNVFDTLIFLMSHLLWFLIIQWSFIKEDEFGVWWRRAGDVPNSTQWLKYNSRIRICCPSI